LRDIDLVDLLITENGFDLLVDLFVADIVSGADLVDLLSIRIDKIRLLRIFRLRYGSCTVLVFNSIRLVRIVSSDLQFDLLGADRIVGSDLQSYLD
jgi:hypothetical protein